MASRPCRWPAAALLIVLALGTGCAPQAPHPPPPATAGAPHPPVADTGPTAVDIARRVARQPLPDVVGDGVERARTRLEASGARTQVVAFDITAVVTAQNPRGGGSPPADGLVTVWVGTPTAPPSPAPPPPATFRPVAPADTAAPAAAPSGPAEASPPGPLPPSPGGDDPGSDAADADGAPQPAPQPAPRPAPRPSDPPPSRSPAPGTVLVGPATWYGPGFAGKPTACGGRFDPEELTMASRELPCGTRARVTGPGGRNVDVTVTDRGPAEWTGKRFDLSAAAFAEIASLSAGTVSVTVEILR